MYITDEWTAYEREIERGIIRVCVLVVGGEIIEACIAGDRYTDGIIPAHYRELAAAL